MAVLFRLNGVKSELKPWKHLWVLQKNTLLGFLYVKQNGNQTKYRLARTCERVRRPEARILEYSAGALSEGETAAVLPHIVGSHLEVSGSGSVHSLHITGRRGRRKHH